MILRSMGTLLWTFDFREIIEELENKKTRKRSKKTFYADSSRNIPVGLGQKNKTVSTMKLYTINSYV